MKTTIEKIILAKMELGNVANNPYPTKLSYWLSRLSDKLDAPYRAYRRQERDLIIKLGVEGENKNFSVLPENMERYAAEIKALVEMEDDVDISPLDISLFEGQDFTPRFFSAMQPFIHEKPEA